MHRSLDKTHGGGLEIVRQRGAQAVYQKHALGLVGSAVGVGGHILPYRLSHLLRPVAVPACTPRHAHFKKLNIFTAFQS